jgi:hypothetical protein
MAAVAVGKGMHPYQLVVKPNHQFVRFKHLVVDLKAGVVQQVAQLHRHLCPVHTDVFVALAKGARPPPGFVKHAPVQVAHKTLGEQVALFLPGNPTHGLQDVGLLPSVQVALRGDVYRYKPGGLIGIKRCCTWRVDKVHV